jgi:hypothetical protein
MVSPAFFTKADGLIPPTVSALPALAGLPILTVYALPPDGVTVKLPAEPLANVYVVLVSYAGTPNAVISDLVTAVTLAT